MTRDELTVPRRTVIKGLAWSVPVVAAAAAVPFAAASNGTAAPSWYFQQVVGESLQPGTLQIRMRAALDFPSPPFPASASLSWIVTVELGNDFVDEMRYIEVMDTSGGGTILAAERTFVVEDLTPSADLGGASYHYTVSMQSAADSDHNDLVHSSSSPYTDPAVGNIEVI
ncbi:MAG: hypothetical protein WBA87_11885 [Microbacterium sp.]